MLQRIAMRSVIGVLFMVACATHATSRVRDLHDDDAAARTCAAEYAEVESNWASYMPREKATSPFKHCPRWRMAMRQACENPNQPSYFDPCHCMCDLCERDSDCGAGASCVEMSSVICGGDQRERVCVHEDDACHPKNAARCATYCVTLFGKPRCVSPDDARMCRTQSR